MLLLRAATMGLGLCLQCGCLFARGQRHVFTYRLSSLLGMFTGFEM